MSAAFKKIEKSLKDAIAFAEGKDVKARVHKPFQVDVKRVRKNVGMPKFNFPPLLVLDLAPCGIGNEMIAPQREPHSFYLIFWKENPKP